MRLYLSNIELDSSDYDVLHDLLLEVMSKEGLTSEDINNEMLNKLWGEIPEDIKLEALQWGISDSLVREKIYLHMLEQKSLDYQGW